MASAHAWTEAHVPDQTGRRVLVTGANSGIGLETARILAGRGAEVVLACRSPEVLARVGERSVAEVMDDIRQTRADAKLEYLELDLSRQASVRAAAEDFRRRFDGLDVLINNAGIMWQPRSLTQDGFEAQMAVNHFGHFTLTGLLLRELLKTAGSRVVTVSSRAHVQGALRLDDLVYERRRYSAHGAYAQSKLANLLFMRELGRRLEAAAAPTISVGAHPGVASTNLFLSSLPGSRRLSAFFDRAVAAVGQSCLAGALPSLYAATAPGLGNGDFFGPGGLLELHGRPGRASSSRASKDIDSARGLWELSERETGIRFAFQSEPCPTTVSAAG